MSCMVIITGMLEKYRDNMRLLMMYMPSNTLYNILTDVYNLLEIKPKAFGSKYIND